MKKEYIPKHLKIEYIKKEALHKLEGNPRKEVDPDWKERLQGLIKKHEFQNPLQVFKEKKGDYSILCGNHRFEAGCDLGMTEFPCIVYEGNRQDAYARAISDNKSNEWTAFEIPLLKDMWAEMDTGDMKAEDTGFTEDELSNLWDYGEKDGKLEEKTEEIKSYKMMHVLLSFPIDKMIEINKMLEPLIMVIEGLEIEQSSN
jgi:hypothetical protein